MMTAPEYAKPDSDRPPLAGCAISSSVERRLQRSGYAALSRVSCEFQRESGVLHLHGAVPSYYLKQVAQELVGDLDAVRLVHNQINVTRTAPRRQSLNRARDEQRNSACES
jgi:osmotically-inducible protein OsmY